MKSDHKMHWHRVGLESWTVWVLALFAVPASLVIMGYLISTPMPIFERVFYLALVLAMIVIAVIMAKVQYNDETAKKAEPEWYEISDRQEFLKRLRERLGKTA